MLFEVEDNTTLIARALPWRYGLLMQHSDPIQHCVTAAYSASLSFRVYKYTSIIDIFSEISTYLLIVQ